MRPARPALLACLLFSSVARAQDYGDGVDLRDGSASTDGRASIPERRRPSEEEAAFDTKENFGAVVAPAVLPGGAAAAYAFVGAPGVGGAYRQGLSLFELEARATFNYLMLSVGLDAIAKYPLLRSGSTQIAATVGVGLLYDTGSRYFDRDNFEHFGIRPRLGAVGTFRASDTVRVVALLDAPWDISASPGGASHFTPTAGGGAEVYLGEDISGLATAQLGADWIKEPQGVTQLRLGYLVRVGVGFRLF